MEVDQESLKEISPRQIKTPLDQSINGVISDCHVNASFFLRSPLPHFAFHPCSTHKARQAQDKLKILMLCLSALKLSLKTPCLRWMITPRRRHACSSRSFKNRLQALQESARESQESSSSFQVSSSSCSAHRSRNIPGSVHIDVIERQGRQYTTVCVYHFVMNIH
jgi:hypothetical protein